MFRVVAEGDAAYTGWDMDRSGDTPEPSEASLSTSAEDIGLRCLNCDYNLTGLADNRCPECNTPFDPDLMRRMLAGEPFPVPIWDDPSQGGLLVRFFRVCWMTWFRPTEFARQMPWRFDARSALSYWITVRIAVILITLLGSLASVDVTDSLSLGIGLFIFAVASLATIIGSILCEGALAVLLGGMVRNRLAPHSTPPTSLSWWYMLSYYSGFLILTVSYLPVRLLIGWVAGQSAGYQFIVYSSMCGWIVGMLLWWSLCIERAIGVRVPQGGNLRLVQAFIPVIALASVAIGWLMACGCCGDFVLP
ncbi:MAG: hypothetical protein GXY55_11300 [Phycisphaerae bacterium]|mgnify:CR=1 FL=1|nr:hypothetical protein [Phycisphaerae bacterium]